MLDEPTSGLDLLVRHEILDRMVDLAAKGKTVLLSSHQVAEVERIADTVAIIHHGRLVVLAPLDELKQQTQELVVTLNNGAVPPTVAGEMLRSRMHARQWQILVRGCPDDELIACATCGGSRDRGSPAGVGGDCRRLFAI